MKSSFRQEGKRAATAPHSQKDRSNTVSTVALIGRKKSASTSLLPKKQNWRRRRTLKSQHRLGRSSETRRPGVRLWRPGGSLRFTFGLASANVGLTLGNLPSHLGPIFSEFSMKRTSRRLFFHEMVDFPRRKQYFGGRVQKERFGSPPREKRDDSKFASSRPYRAKKKVRAFFFARKKEHLVGRLNFVADRAPCPPVIFETLV